MTGKIPHPENKHPEPYQSDMNPDASKGINYDQLGDEPADRTAHEVKDLHTRLQDFSDDELKQIPVLNEGARLEMGATYLTFNSCEPFEFQSDGTEQVEKGTICISKKAVPYELWNRMVGERNPTRTKITDESFAE